MKQRLKNQNGTTLVELIVCMVLLAIFTLAAVTLIQPSAQAYMDIQQQMLDGTLDYVVLQTAPTVSFVPADPRRGARGERLYPLHRRRNGP